MAIKDRLYADRTKYLKDRNELGLSTLRGLIAAVEGAEKNGIGEPIVLSDARVQEVLNTELKKRRSAASEYAKAGRTDRAERELAEGELIKEYLPYQLTEEAVADLVNTAIKELGENANIGQVMKLVNPHTKGRADGKLVSGLVKAKLDEIAQAEAQAAAEVQ